MALRALALVGFLTLAACGSGGSDETATIAGTTFSSNESAGTATITSAQGSLAVASGDAAQATKMPDYAPQYPGSKIISVLGSAKDGVAKSTVSLETGDTVSAVADFYSKTFSDQGLTTKPGVKTAEVAMLRGEGQGKTATVLVSTENGKTSIILSFWQE